jgi:hypothetical protein
MPACDITTEYSNDIQRPWSLKTIFILSVFFSPLAGLILAYINTQRLSGKRDRIFLIFAGLFFVLTNVLAYSVWRGSLSINDSRVAIFVISVVLWFYIYTTHRRVLLQQRLSQTGPGVYAPWVSALPYAVTADVLFAIFFLVTQLLTKSV